MTTLNDELSLAMDSIHAMYEHTSDEHDRLRHLWVIHHRQRWEMYEAHVAWMELHPAIRMETPVPPQSMPFPEELRGLSCGAKTRAGTACKRNDLWDSGRCKLHGGISTGPRTKRGKRRSSRNGFKPKRTL